MKNLLAALLAIAGLLLTVFGTQSVAIAQGADGAAGKAVYESSCAGCHSADGTGVAGRGRPLTDIASQGDRATHLASIKDGKGNMPGFGERLSAQELEDVTDYVRVAFAPVADDAAADEAADATAEAAATAELAVTGSNTALLTLAGLTLLVAGAMLMAFGRKEETATFG